MSTTSLITERRTAVDADGWLYDVDSGEVLGIPDLPDEFAVDCVQAADAALEIRARLEARLAALRMRKAALIANIESLEADQRRRLAWWDWRFGHGLVEFARSMLGRGKTAKFVHGSVSFRATKGTNRIIDMESAVAWMRDVDPERVRVVESVLVSDVLATRREGDVLPWLESTGPGESVTISTGITREETR
ncbi:MAG: hypothetical protein VW239_00535 [Candidatus Nanopelagicales bacterium]